MTNFEREESRIKAESENAQRYAMAQIECGAWEAEYAEAWLANRLGHLQAEWNELHSELKVSEGELE